VMCSVEWVGVFACSVWSSLELAERECERLNAACGYETSKSYDVHHWVLDSPDGVDRGEVEAV
jgi:hypothetical protein